MAIPGFAKFVKVDRAARMGRNPATGEAIRIKASKKARITPVKAFKDAVLAPSTAPKLKKGAYPIDSAAVAAAGKSVAVAPVRASVAKAPAKKAPAAAPRPRRLLWRKRRLLSAVPRRRRRPSPRRLPWPRRSFAAPRRRKRSSGPADRLRPPKGGLDEVHRRGFEQQCRSPDGTLAPGHSPFDGPEGEWVKGLTYGVRPERWAPPDEGNPLLVGLSTTPMRLEEREGASPHPKWLGDGADAPDGHLRI